MKPRVLMSDLVAAKEVLDSVKYKLDNKQITFLDAVKRYSEDEISKNAGGRVLNPGPEAHCWPLKRWIPPFSLRSTRYPLACCRVRSLLYPTMGLKDSGWYG